MNTYCYACETYNSGISWNTEDTEPICRRCHSSFVELVPQAGSTHPSASDSQQRQQGSRQQGQQQEPRHHHRQQGVRQQQQQTASSGPGMQHPSGPGAPQMQSHTFMTSSGQEVHVHMATSVMPVGMDSSDLDGGLGANAGGMPQAILTSLLQGMQQHADGGSGSPGHPFHAGMQFGGFGMGNFAGDNSLEALLSRLAEQHQPMFVPTAPDTRTSLPRLKVATPAQAAAAARTAPSVCTATQPASRADSDDAQPRAQQQAQQQHGQHAACKAGDACTVCHEECEAGTTVVQLPCSHCFHEDCIMPWLEQHNTCPVCRFQLPADPDHRVQPQAGPAPLSSGGGGDGLGPPASDGSNVWSDVGNLFPGDAAQILGSITAALDGVLGSQAQEARERRRREGEALHARVQAAVARSEAAQRERESAAGGRGRRRRAATPAAPGGSGDGRAYRPGSATDGTALGNRRVRRRTELHSGSDNALEGVADPAAAAGAATADASRPARTIGIPIVRPFNVGRHPGHTGARNRAASVRQQQGGQHHHADQQLQHVPGEQATQTGRAPSPQPATGAAADRGANAQPAAALSQHAAVTPEIQPAPLPVGDDLAVAAVPQGRAGDAVSQGFSLPLLAPVGWLASGAAQLVASIFRR